MQVPLTVLVKNFTTAPEAAVPPSVSTNEAYCNPE